MLKTLSLILPALVPSWRFFKAIEPSPRVQWALVDAAGMVVDDWRVFRPRPQTVSGVTMLRRLFWNPVWNETLFVVSCSERIAEEPTDHGVQTIARFIQNDNAQALELTGKSMRFRLVFVTQSGAERKEDILFTSPPLPARREPAQ